MAAPRKEANTVSEKFTEEAKARQMARAKEAPALIPRIPESASGFRVTPCIIAPLAAKAAPIRISPIVLGSLSSTTAICS